MNPRLPKSSLVRLQKYLNDAGIASRRHAEGLIEEGRVWVNGKIVDRLPAFIDPKHDRVTVDGDVVRPAPLRYFIVHKPKGVVCAGTDVSGRQAAIDLLPPGIGHMFPVGQLDADSSGLLLMTNDGELAQSVSHPRFGIPKIYRVDVKGRATPGVVGELRDGVYLSEGKARAAECRILHASDRASVLSITMNEAHNRQVQRMLAKLGFPVKDLKRVQIGPIVLKGLPLGASRELSDFEVRQLREAVESAAATAGPPVRKPRRGSVSGSRRDRARKRVAGDSKASGAPRRERKVSTRRSENAEPKRRLIT